MPIQEALERAIHAVAPSAVIDLESKNGHLTAIVVAPEFENLTHLYRQQKIWKEVREKLGSDSAKVGILLLYSPEEASALEDE